MLVLATVLSRLLRTRALVALTCIWATLLFANIASAVPHVQAKTRVWGFGQSAPLHIWLDASVTPRSRPEIRSASPDLASRSLLAARGLPAATMIGTQGGATIRAGVSAAELLLPNGVRIGEAGASASIRVIQGGSTEAGALFEQLSRGGTAFTGAYRGTAVSLPGGGFVGLRSVATGTGARVAPLATIDVNIPGIAIRELKFVP